MGWKSIEMQVALPRTQEAGKHQDQMSKQNQRFQESLAQSQLKQQQQQRKRINEFERIRGMKISEENDESSSEQQEEQEETIDHPFLGTNIDFNR